MPKLFCRLEELESDLEGGDITKKGYCKKKWQLLEPHVKVSVSKQILDLEAQLKSTKISEVCDDYN